MWHTDCTVSVCHATGWLTSISLSANGGLAVLFFWFENVLLLYVCGRRNALVFYKWLIDKIINKQWFIYIKPKYNWMSLISNEIQWVFVLEIKWETVMRDPFTLIYRHTGSQNVCVIHNLILYRAIPIFFHISNIFTNNFTKSIFLIT